MKKLIFLTICTFSFQMLFGQIAESPRSMSQGSNNGFNTLLKKSEKKEAVKLWEKFMKDYKGKTKSVKKSDELMTDNATIEQISTNTVDVYALFIETGEDVELNVWYDLGGTYLTSHTHPEAYNYVIKMLEDFVDVADQAVVQRHLETEEDNLKKMEKDLSGLEKDKTNLEAEIEKYKQKIIEAEQAIEQNVQEQQLKQEEINTQQETVKMVASKLKGQ